MEKVNPVDGSGMILIPAGEFLMGSIPGEGRDDEHPHHKVILPGFLLSVHPVTNAQFARFAAESRYKTAGVWNTWNRLGRENHPVVGVTWNDAQAYCKWAGGSLPTEAQWEKGARGTDGRRFPWGNDWAESRCNWEKGPKLPVMTDLAEGVGTAPVGSFPEGVSPYGLHDMMGNVWEWCADWYAADYYSKSPGESPEGPGEGAHRTMRGGSWTADEDIDPLEDLRCAARRKFNPTYRYRLDLGFRVCLPALGQ